MATAPVACPLEHVQVARRAPVAVVQGMHLGQSRLDGRSVMQHVGEHQQLRSRREGDLRQTAGPCVRPCVIVLLEILESRQALLADRLVNQDVDAGRRLYEPRATHRLQR